ncbi:uncharacterized protein MYCGRDRAFT_104355, partial [Zymoseptoria tritici IPO323]
STLSPSTVDLLQPLEHQLDRRQRLPPHNQHHTQCLLPANSRLVLAHHQTVLCLTFPSEEELCSTTHDLDKPPYLPHATTVHYGTSSELSNQNDVCHLLTCNARSTLPEHIPKRSARRYKQQQEASRTPPRRYKR